MAVSECRRQGSRADSRRLRLAQTQSCWVALFLASAVFTAARRSRDLQPRRVTQFGGGFSHPGALRLRTADGSPKSPCSVPID